MSKQTTQSTIVTQPLVKDQGHNSIPSSPRSFSKQPKHHSGLYLPCEEKNKKLTANRSDFFPPPPHESSLLKADLIGSDNRHYGGSDEVTYQQLHKQAVIHGEHGVYSSHTRLPKDRQMGPTRASLIQRHKEGTASWHTGKPERNGSTFSQSITSLDARKQTSGQAIDHTYRDFSGVPPSNEDLERYANKKREYNRILKKRENSSETPSESEQSKQPQGKQHKKRGRGSKSRRNNNGDFVGFMGTNFPARLHDLLSHENGISDIITWLPHGRSWIVRDKKEFLKKVAPSHFQISKFESFTRQVNGWGFKRITQGPDINSYYHELFLQSMPHLIQWMKRASSSSQGGVRKKVRSDPKDEPNFYDISASYPIPDYYGENGGVPVSVPASSCPRETQPAMENAQEESNSKPRDYLKKDIICKHESRRYYHHFNHLSRPARDWNYGPVEEQGTGYKCHDPKNHFVHSPNPHYPAPKRSKHTDQYNNHVLKDMNADDFWTNVPYKHHQNRKYKDFDHEEYAQERDFYDISAPAVSNEDSCGASTDVPVATKNHWQTFYDALVDDENNCSNLQDCDDGVEKGDVDYEPNHIHDITPIPVNYGSNDNHHRPSQHNHGSELWGEQYSGKSDQMVQVHQGYFAERDGNILLQGFDTKSKQHNSNKDYKFEYSESSVSPYI